MNQTRTFDWTRIAIEGVVIVVSILLAFSIQAWWDERQEQIEVQEMLQGVIEDFDTSKKYIDSYRSFAVARQTAALSLMEIGLDPSVEPDRENIDRMLSELDGFWTVVPVITGSVDTLALSGNLALVENEEVRTMLSVLRTDIEQYRLATKSEYEFWFQVWHPYMRQHGFLPQTYKARDSSTGSAWAGWPAFPMALPEPFDHSEILADKEFQNILLTQWYLQTWIVRILDSAIERLEHNISLIRQEIDE